ncbi:MAG TPA: hypothetical protein VG097_19275 [Gemmata sp.]|jgi:hypothetical protein|nr:hypothetical protein [Gemmata sp.]
MSAPRENLINWLRGEFAEEQCGGFARLKRVPDTHVIRFLDHFASLNAVEQSELKSVLAEWSSYRLEGVAIPIPISEKFSRATAVPGLIGGVRYTGVNMLAGLANNVGSKGLEGFFRQQGVVGLSLQFPENLVRNHEDLIPVEITVLRQLVQRKFTSFFQPEIKEVEDDIWWYTGTLANSTLRVQIRYSAKMGVPQLKYQIEMQGNGLMIAAPDVCFESILGVGFGRWDYLTQENAERSVDLLCELVDYVARLPERIPK